MHRAAGAPSAGGSAIQAGMRPANPSYSPFPPPPTRIPMAHDLHATLRRTPLHGVHAALGAKLVPFAGFEMPVHYPTGITEEHRAVRTRCGLFDVSHMGEFEITGPGAVDFVNFVTTNDVAKLAIGQVH